MTNDTLRKIGFVDIHSHILPEVDDGAQNLDVSINMLKIAEKYRSTHIISTPHYIHDSINNSVNIIKEKFNTLVNKSKEAGLKINIYPGCEIFICPELPDLIENGLVSTLNNSAYVLIELPLMSIPPYTDDIFYRLQLKGYRPIIAHPERNSEIINDPNLLYDFVIRGVLTQINSNSFTGMYGNKVKDTAFTLLKHSMVHFIASDAHSARKRTPRLTKAFKLLEGMVDAGMLTKLFCENGLAVINNKDIDIIYPDKIIPRKNFIASSLFNL